MTLTDFSDGGLRAGEYTATHTGPLTPQVYIGINYQHVQSVLKFKGIKFNQGIDLVLSTDDPNAHQRILAMDLDPGQVWFVGHWRLGRHAHKLWKWVVVRLRKGTRNISDCRCLDGASCDW